jgi:hypothetical protein
LFFFSKKVFNIVQTFVDIFPELQLSLRQSIASRVTPFRCSMMRRKGGRYRRQRDQQEGPEATKSRHRQGADREIFDETDDV